MELDVKDTTAIVFDQEESRLPASPHGCEMTENNDLYLFLQNI